MSAYIICAALVTAGMFIVCGCGLGDIFRVLMKPFGRRIERTKHINKLTGKRPSALHRTLEEATNMLDSSGHGEQLPMYRNMAIGLSAAGFLFGLVIDNLLIGIILACGLALTPLTVIRLRTADYDRMMLEKLESAMGSVTNSYITTGDLLTAVENTISLLPAPLDGIFRRYIVDMKLVGGNGVRAIERMRTGIDNWHWQQWCSVLIQCQDDSTLRYALPDIVRQLSDERQIQIEVDTALRKQMSDYAITVMLVLGSIPMMGFMMPEWYDMLMGSLPGKITLAVVLFAVLATSLWVSRAGSANQTTKTEGKSK